MVLAKCVCVAENGKPLFIATRPSTQPKDESAHVFEDLQYHSIVHAAIGVVEERHGDLYLGLLYPAEEHLVYGYITNTQVCFVAVFENGDLKDGDVKSFFKQLHASFLEVSCNPFYVAGTPIESAGFRAAVDKMLVATSK